MSSPLTRQVTGRKQAEAKKILPTDEDYTRLQRLFTRPWSPFRKMSPKELQKLSEKFELLEYQPGDIIMQKGVMGRHLYILDDGSIELFNLKYGQKPVLVATIDVNKKVNAQVHGKLNQRFFGLTSLRLAVEQPVGARAAHAEKPVQVWRMSADAYDISLQNRDGLKELFTKYASVEQPQQQPPPQQTNSSSSSRKKLKMKDSRLAKRMTHDDFFQAMMESDSELQESDSEETYRSLKGLFSIADGAMNDPTGLLSFPEFAGKLCVTFSFF